MFLIHEKRPGNCVDPTVYGRLAPKESFKEARVILIAKYLEHELAQAAATEMERHLNRCAYCSKFSDELSGTEDFSNQTVPFAVCPSSEILDIFLFDPNVISMEEKQRIGNHLEQCPLCREETDWLRSIEQSRPINFSLSGKKWFLHASVAAAVVFMLLSSLLLWQKHKASFPGKELRELAVIKEPSEVDFAGLEKTSTQLSTGLNQVYNEGITLFKAGQYYQASIVFQKILNDSPHSASLYLLGYCYYKLNDGEKAFLLCDQAERMQPKSNERCLLLLNIALKTGHFDRALMEICALYHDFPDDPAVRNLYLQINSLKRGNAVRM
ncbi:hypothetical protein L0156_16295 [bacterium]|nr:hypothetical protein [bacterium]